MKNWILPAALLLAACDSSSSGPAPAAGPKAVWFNLADAPTLDEKLAASKGKVVWLEFGFIN